MTRFPVCKALGSAERNDPAVKNWPYSFPLTKLTPVQR